MQLCKIQIEHLAEIDNLFVSHGYQSGVTECASDTGLCYIKDNKIIGAIFVYLTNSPLCELDLLVVDKSLNRKDRDFVVDNLTKASINLGIMMGKKKILARPKFKKSKERLIDLCFKADKNGLYWLGV